MAGEATRLLTAAGSGDAAAAEQLTPLLYDELRALAGRYLNARKNGVNTLQPTALVHEAFLRLIGHDEIDPRSRTHFFAAAANAMRWVLVDYARAKAAEKRGGGRTFLTLQSSDGVVESEEVDVLALHELLERLAELSPRAARVVDMRFFGGMSVSETAQVLGVSERTVKGDWRTARAWLRAELERTGAEQ